MKKIFIISILSILSFKLLFAEKIIFSSNNMSGKAGDSSTTTTLNGNAYIKTESMEIQADSVELSGDDYRYIKARGAVTGKNLETNMEFRCDTLEYDRTTKVAQIQGNVSLKDIDNEVEAKAQIIVYNQETDIAILQIQINLTQKDNVCTGSYAVYYKKNKLLELSGNAQVKQKDDTFRAQFITLDMDTQDIVLGGNVKGTVTDKKTVKSKEEEEAQESEAADSEEGEAVVDESKEMTDDKS